MTKITKRDGTVVAFRPEVLDHSLRQAGAPADTAARIVADIRASVQDGETTEDIYKRAFALLGSQAKRVAMRYSLKRALFNFGPTGFPFEDFIAELFRRRGYDTTTNVRLQGKCTQHEVDILATGKERIAMEAKFHNAMHLRSDLKTALYVKARFDDLTKTTFYRGNGRDLVDRCILVTNTKFTTRAIEYATCARVTLLGWGYPVGNGLERCIETVQAHPVTCLPSLTPAMMRYLFESGIVTCKQMLSARTRLQKHFPSEMKLLLGEARILCTPQAYQ